MIYQTFRTTTTFPFGVLRKSHSTLSPSSTSRNRAKSKGIVVRKDGVFLCARITFVFDIKPMYGTTGIKACCNTIGHNTYIPQALIGACSCNIGDMDENGKQEDGTGFGYTERRISGSENRGKTQPLQVPSEITIRGGILHSYETA